MQATCVKSIPLLLRKQFKAQRINQVIFVSQYCRKYTLLAAIIMHAAHAVLITYFTQIPPPTEVTQLVELQLKFPRHHQFVDFKIPSIRANKTTSSSIPDTGKSG